MVNFDGKLFPLPVKFLPLFWEKQSVISPAHFRSSWRLTLLEVIKDLRGLTRQSPPTRCLLPGAQKVCLVYQAGLRRWPVP